MYSTGSTGTTDLQRSTELRNGHDHKIIKDPKIDNDPAGCYDIEDIILELFNSTRATSTIDIHQFKNN